MIGHPRQRWRAFRERRVRRRLAGPKLIMAFAESYPEPFFIEIGANDASQHDHLAAMVRERSWRGIMVEPVPYVFERLRANYEDFDRVTLANAAIADRDGRMPFYHLAEAEDGGALPDWYDAIGSFSREAVAGHAEHIPDIEARIVELDVPTLTFDSLCARHGVDSVDLLLIDTEGYDYEILQQIDLDRWRPRLLIYEHFHLDVDERSELRLRLERAGYRLLEEGFDTWCLRDGPEDALSELWPRLRPGIPALAADRS